MCLFSGITHLADQERLVTGAVAEALNASGCSTVGMELGGLKDPYCRVLCVEGCKAQGVI